MIINDLWILRGELERAFAYDTSFDPSRWTLENPASGHCAAVSYLIWQRFGGNMVSAKVHGESHWFNRIYYSASIDADVDLTGDQFGLPPFQISARELYPDSRVRHSCEVNVETRLRTKMLASRIV